MKNIGTLVRESDSITDFQKKVYLELLKVPAGKTISYKDLAERIGCGSAQAVGQALRRNPFAPDVPCHRVIASDGSIGGFHGHREGDYIDKKRKLLEMESSDMEEHPLEPFLPEGGKLLMLGSFPPQRKRWCMDFFYPNFTNDMWRLMGSIFYGDHLHFVDTEARIYRKDDIVGFLGRVGIGIYDTACAVRRLNDNASDKFLEVVRTTDIEALLARMPQCRAIVTTGQKATGTICGQFGIRAPQMGGHTGFLLHGDEFRLYRMPSTSRAYPMPLAAKAESYGRMFSELGML